MQAPSSIAIVQEPIIISRYEVLLGDIKEAQQEAVERFDYASKAGNEACRSYVFRLRKIKARVEAARKEAKADALAYGKRVDAQAKELTEQVEELIRPHEEQLNAITQAEAERVAALKGIFDHATQLGELPFAATSAMIQARLVTLDEIQLDQLQEFREPTAAAIVTSRQRLQVALETALAKEEQEQELARLQAEAAAREARERDERIRRDAQEKADAEAQAAAADAIAEAETRAAQAEAKLAAAEIIPAIHPADTDAVTQAVPVAAPAPSVPTWRPGEAEAAMAARSSRMQRLEDELEIAMRGMNRAAVVAAIVGCRLHPAVVVDWERVGDAV
jgi:hypothetical protein